jgi:HK97 family phage major capsid protein
MSDLVKKLAEKRAALLTEASSIVADAADRGVALEGEQNARVDLMTAEAGRLADAIKAEKNAAEARTAAAEVRAENAAVFAPKTEEPKDTNSELRRIAREGGSIELRDITKSTFTQPVTQDNSFWVTAGQVNPFLDAAVVSIMNVSTGNAITFPRTTALGTAAAVSEGSAIGESDGTSDSLSLTPAKYGTLLQISLEQATDAMFDVASWIAAKASVEVAVAHGAVAGPAVAAAATIGKTSTTLAPTYADLVDLVYSVKQQYRRKGTAGFMANDATLGGIVKLLDSQNRPIFIPGDLSKPDSLLGFPVYSAALANTGANALHTVFGDLKSIYTAVVAPGVSVESSKDYAFNVGLVTYRIIVRGATGLVDGSAVKSLKSSAS